MEHIQGMSSVSDVRALSSICVLFSLLGCSRKGVDLHPFYLKEQELLDHFLPDPFRASLGLQPLIGGCVSDNLTSE